MSISISRTMPPNETPDRRIARRPRRELREVTLLAATVLVVLGVGIFRPSFMSFSNIEFMVLSSVVLGLVGISQTFVIMTRGIDLSVSAVLGLSAMIFGLLDHHEPDDRGSLAAMHCVGCAVGMFQWVARRLAEDSTDHRDPRDL